MKGSRQKLFGFEIQSSNKNNKVSSPIEMTDENGLPIGGAYSSGHLTDFRFKSQNELIQTYRDIALHSEVDYAIDEIVNEAFVYDSQEEPVAIQLENTGLDKSIQNKIRDEFHNIIRLLNFKSNCYEIFRRWYIDGRIYFNIVLDEKKPKEGIKEIRFIDPLQLKHISEPQFEKDEQGNLIYSKKSVKEYYEYYPMGLSGNGAKQKVYLTKDSIVYVPSGLYDRSRGIVLSYLDKVIKPLNNLRALEDSKVVHTLARAPMRRAFYIDVDGLSPSAGDQHIRETAARFRNKIDYDSKTGAVLNNRSYQAMMEDLWLPRRDGKNTEIDILEGSGDLLDMPSVQHYKRNVFQALNVPTARLEQDQSFGWGRDAEISREELKFNKFIVRLRHSFSKLFNDVLRTQLSVKGIVNYSDWDNLSSDVYYEWKSEMYYEEMQKLEILQKRLDVLRDVVDYQDEYYSDEYIRKIVLGQSEQEIKDLKEQRLKKEKESENELDDMDSNDFDLNDIDVEKESKKNNNEEEKESDTLNEKIIYNSVNLFEEKLSDDQMIFETFEELNDFNKTINNSKPD